MRAYGRAGLSPYPLWAPLLLLGVTGAGGWAGQDPPAPVTDDTPQRLRVLRQKLQPQDAQSAEAARKAFYEDPAEEVVIVAGRQVLAKLQERELAPLVRRLAAFPGPLPVLNLGPLLAERIEAQQVQAQLLALWSAKPPWWVERNLAILAGFVPDERLVGALLQGALGTKSRPLRLEVLRTLSRIRKPAAVQAIQALFRLDNDPELHAACFRALAGAGSAQELPWLMEQLQEDTLAAVVGGWAVGRLTDRYPARGVAVLLNSAQGYVRRAGLRILEDLGGKDDWRALLGQVAQIRHPEILEAVGEHFWRNPEKEAAQAFLRTAQHCSHDDFRVKEAWCRALGACAALGDEKVRKGAFQALARESLVALAPPTKAQAQIKASNEQAVAAIYGLAALRTEEAYEHLIRLALGANHEVPALYAAVDLAREHPLERVEKFRRALVAHRERGEAAFGRAVLLLGVMPQLETVEVLIDSLSRAGKPEQRSAARAALGWLTGHDFGEDAQTWRNWWKDRPFRFYDDKLAAARRERGAPDYRPPVPEKTDLSRGYRCLDLYALRSNPEWSMQQFGATAASEWGIALGLRWLANHQDPDGKWSGVHFIDLDIGQQEGERPDWKLSNSTLDIGLTGLALLAYLAANHAPGKADSIYRPVVERALEWYGSQQLNDGSFQEAGKVARGGFNYYHYELGLSALALSEAYALARTESLRRAAQRSLDKIFSNQTPGEGWRYAVRYQTDSSVVGWMAMALKSGALAGLEVDPRCRVGILRYYDQTCTRPKEAERFADQERAYEDSVGSFSEEEGWGRYTEDAQGFKGSSAAIAAGNRIFLGYMRSHPFSVAAANYLKNHLPSWEKAENEVVTNQWFPLYYFYYGTLLMHQMGGGFWSNWNTVLQKVLLPRQAQADHNQAGSFPPVGSCGKVGGQVYSTAICILTLETYCRYLPMLWFEPQSARERLAQGEDERGKKTPPGAPGEGGGEGRRPPD